MIDDLIDRLNHLCRKFVSDQEHFTDSQKLRKVFMEIKELGYSVYSDPYDISTIVPDYLSDTGRENYTKLQGVRQQKMDCIAKQNFEQAADFRDVERRLEREVMLDYIKKDGIAYFKIHNRDSKEIVCYYYCELLIQFFRIGV